MQLTIRLAVLVAMSLLMTSYSAAQQIADPVTGTWAGDWGPSPTDRNAVTLELKWDGKTITGLVNPGPDGILIESGSFDPKTMKIHLEANYAPRNRRYVMDGTVEKGKMSGTWNHPGRMGDFQVSIQGKTEQPATTPKPNLAGLKPDEQKVVQYLLNDWGEWEKDYSITSIDIAMDALQLPASADTRFRIGDYIKRHPELHELIREWGWQTIVLTPTEKLLARAIVNAQSGKQKVPSKSELAGLVGVSEKEAEEGIRTLSRYGILKRDRSAGGIGYIASQQRYLNWQPWLDFQFHRMTLASGRTVAVN
jgi:hypothetical protein